jgi:hypothetical protein
LRLRRFAGFAFGLPAFLTGLRTSFLAGFFLLGFLLAGFATVFFFGFGALRAGLAGLVLRDGLGLGLGLAGFDRLGGGVVVVAGRFAGSAAFLTKGRLRSASSGPLAMKAGDRVALPAF